MSRTETELKELRKEIFLTALCGGMAHLASAYSCLELIYALYIGGVMKHDPHCPEMPERDRFVLSKGHGSLALYTVMCLDGYFTKEQLHSFTRPDTFLGGEPSLCIENGIEASTGSLGHGLSIGVGMALALRKDQPQAKVYVLVGDGECQEGSMWEAVMSAAKYSLDNLVMIIDSNRIQKMDTTEAVMGISDWKDRLEAFGWDCARVDGHDVNALVKTFRAIKPSGKPIAILADTVKGKGVSLMENNPAWHWRMPNRKESRVFMRELDITEEEIEGCKKRI